MRCFVSALCNDNTVDLNDTMRTVSIPCCMFPKEEAKFPLYERRNSKTLTKFGQLL